MAAAPIRLTVETGNIPNTFRFRAAFPAPAADAAGSCAPAVLAFGDGQSTDLGLLCAPTAVTWREQHRLELAAHTYAGAGPYQAELRWGDEAWRVAVSPAAPDFAPAAADLPEVVLFATHDHKFLSTVANRIVEFTPGGFIDRAMSFDEYLESAEVAKMREELFQGHAELVL